MSGHKIALALAFIESHSDAAAGILEQQPPCDVAAFLQQVPAKDAAQVIRKMLNQQAAAVCAELPFEAGLSILSQLSAPDAVSILRSLSTKVRERFIAEFPIKTRVSCMLLLGYGQEMAGAHITNSVTVVPDDSNAEAALRVIKASSEEAPCEFVFVVDRDKKLKGRFRLVDLLRCPNELPVSSLMKTHGKTIQGRININEAATHPSWKRHEFIAVLNRNEEFIGILRHADLRKAIAALNEQAVHDEQPELMTGIAQGYGQSLLALFLSMKDFVASDLQTLQGVDHD